MSMYNLVHGVNPLAAIVLAMLGFRPSMIPRFRDAFYNGTELCIYTRTGGGNREHWDAPNPNNTEGPWNTTLRESPFFLRDEDDGYDSTYATFYFSIPPQYEPAFSRVAANDIAKPASERWKDAIERLKTAGPDDPDVKRVMAAFQPLVDMINKGESGGIVEI